jgi:hypothetical protein
MATKYQTYDTEEAFVAPTPVQTPTPTPTPTLAPVVGETQDFQSLVRDYISKNNPKIYLLTPMFGGVCHAGYMTSIIQTLLLFKDLGLKVQLETCLNDSLVTRARNNLVSRAMNDPETTHILFVDADISFSPESILKLLLAEKEVVCGIYPLKKYFFERLLSDPMNPYNSNVVQTWIDKKNNSQLREFVSDEAAIQFNLLRYNVNFISNTLKIENNITEIRHAPTGFLMIKRVVFEKLFQSYPGLQYTDDVSFARPGEEQFSFNIFDTATEKMPDGKSHLLSEDFVFCERYRKIDPENHKVYCDVSINLGHSGINTFQGSFISSLL